MSKIRIYELAKELGLDNRVVVAKAQELGMKGKSSHSHSLESDEADQLRRSFIRQAIGTRVVEPSETVTTRIDPTTGESGTVLEKRRGNVIMRRKQAGAPEPQIAAEKIQEEVTKKPSLGDELFEESAISETAEVTEVDETQDLDTDSVKAGDEEVAQSEDRRPGPRVLGKIQLAAPKKAKPEVRTADKSGVVRPAKVVEEEEEGAKKKGIKGKSRRRELSRIDLVDYEVGDSRRGGRGHGKGPHGKESHHNKEVDHTDEKVGKAAKRVVKLADSISVGELARQMSVKASDVIAKLIALGVMATINQLIDKDTATLIAEEFDCEISLTSFDEEAAFDDLPTEDEAKLQPRPPVVTVMGHVDHGKTTLLDSIRNASVAAKEHGGITQHIGAYKVVLEDKRSIAFIDTPGHAAFTSMRARGAEITDVVILVVAADDGVMPQTIEAINHAKAAKVPIVVAVNKVDKPGAQPEKIRQQLVEHGLQPEDWGGDTMFFNVSAKKNEGIKQLLEGVLLLSEMKELKANPDTKAKGTIIEARQDRGRGTVATVLVQSGTLRVGDLFVVGAHFGRVRSMLSENGDKIKEAGPSTPVEITGLNGIPEAGDDFRSVDSEATAREISSHRAVRKANEDRRTQGGPMSLEEFAKRASDLAATELVIILKADVHGSLEAVREAVEKLTTEKVRVKVIHAAVGGITESDIQLAIATKAIVVGFGVRAEPRALEDAERNGVDVRFYRVIYELLDEIRGAMVGLLEPDKQEVQVGRVEVREVFSIPKIGTIAGSYVVDGTIKRGTMARVVRDSRVVYEGKMGSLRRFKDDVREVQKGYECGIGIENFNDMKVGDVIEVFETKDIAATLD